MKQVVVIEPDRALAGEIREVFAAEGLACLVAHDAWSGLVHLVEGEYAVGIVSGDLLTTDGCSILERIRFSRRRMPILALTASEKIEDRVNLLGLGADDCLRKPFYMRELLARVRALLRRPPIWPLFNICVAGLHLNIDRRTAAYSGENLSLSKTEYRLLEYLLRRRKRVCTRDAILENIWGYDFDGSANNIDVTISKLRQKLRAAGAPQVVEVVRGIGYRIKSCFPPCSRCRS